MCFFVRPSRNYILEIKILIPVSSSLITYLFLHFKLPAGNKIVVYDQCGQ